MKFRQRRRHSNFGLDQGESSVNLSALERGPSFRTEDDIELMSRANTQDHKNGAIITITPSI
jgi:hypothetical protein